MQINEFLTKLIEDSSADNMPKAASELLELVEADEVEPLGQPGETRLAEEIASGLETKLEQLKKRRSTLPRSAAAVEEAVSYLRANEGLEISPWSFEDSNGIHWFVLVAEEDEDDVIACYNTAPFSDAGL